MEYSRSPPPSPFVAKKKKQQVSAERPLGEKIDKLKRKSKVTARGRDRLVVEINDLQSIATHPFAAIHHGAFAASLPASMMMKSHRQIARFLSGVACRMGEKINTPLADTCHLRYALVETSFVARGAVHLYAIFTSARGSVARRCQ